MQNRIVRIFLTSLMLLSQLLTLSPAYSQDRLETLKISPPDYLQGYLQQVREAEAKGLVSEAAKACMKCVTAARSRGDYQYSIQYSAKAIEWAEKSPEKKILVNALLTSAKAFIQVGQYDKAMELLKYASKVSEKAGYNNLQARANGFMAQIQIEHYKNYKEGAAYLKRIDNYYENVEREKNSRSPAGFSKWLHKGKGRHLRVYLANLTTVGRAYLKIGQYDLALERLTKSLEYGKDQFGQVSDTYYWLGVIYQKMGDNPKAVEYFDKALVSLKIYEKAKLSSMVYSSLAVSYRKLKQFDNATVHFEKALSLLENLRTTIQSEQIRQSYLETVIPIYDNYIDHLCARGNAEEAFNISERERARTLLDILGTKVDLEREQIWEIAGEEHEYIRRISELQLKLQESEENDDDNIVDDTEKIMLEIAQLNEQYSGFLAKLAKSDPEHFSLVAVNPLTIREVQSMLSLGDRLIEFHVLPNKLLVWSVTSNNFTMNEVNVSRENLVENVKGLRNLLESGDAVRSLKIKTASKSDKPNINTQETDKALRNLYKLLLGKIPINKGDKLIIVPHGILHYLPFQALKAPDGFHLVENNTVSYLSSASLFKFIREKRKPIGDDLLAFGNPDFGVTSLQLHYAEQEVRDIGKFFPQSKILTGAQASKGNAQDLSGRYNVLHFATHALFNEELPLESSLLLAKDLKGDIAHLTVREVFKLRLNSSLVVLSACETMLGGMNTGDELVGFTRAFLYAGTPSIITTLWKIDDQASSLLMKEFYSGLRSLGKAEALRAAQLSVKEKYNHPYFWAAFVLSGD